MKSEKNLTGKKFGKLLVVKPGPPYGTSATWLSKCDCGNDALIKKQWQPLTRNPSFDLGVFLLLQT